MGQVLQFPRQVAEPFRLEGRANLNAGMRTVRLLETSRQLRAVADRRRREDCDYLRQAEVLLRQQLARQEAEVEVLEETVSAAQIVAPEVLSQLAFDQRALLVITRRDTGQGAAFECASRGAVLAAETILLIPRRRPRLTSKS